DALGLDAAVLGLGLRVAEEQLEPDPALPLDPARGVDRLDGHLRPETTRLAGLGERAGYRVDRADLERLRLGAKWQRKPEDRGARGRCFEEGASGRSIRHAKPPGSTIKRRAAPWQ